MLQYITMALVPQWGPHNTAMQGFRLFIDNFLDRFVNQPRFQQQTMSYVAGLLQRLDTNWEGYKRSHQAIASLAPFAEQDVLELDDQFELEMETVARNYDVARAAVESRITEMKSPSQVIVPSSLPRASKVVIPSFSGKYLEYTAFRSAVMARVYNEAYPTHEKIDIIIRSLTGVAKSHIGEVRGQDDLELARIWRCLEETYHNQYLLQRSHMGAIYEQPEIRSESAAAYRDMVNRINQNMHALEQLDIPTGQLDPAILEMVLRKLDPNCTNLWETMRPKKVLPTIASFISFLEDRIVVLQNTAIQAGRSEVKTVQADRGSYNRAESSFSQRTGRNRVVDGNKRVGEQQFNGESKRYRSADEHGARNGGDGRPKAPVTCLMECSYKRPHQLWLCNKFKAMDLDKRIAFIKKHGLCRRCVTLKHNMEHCKSPKCNDCTEDIHNQVLCPKLMVIAKANTTRMSKENRGRGNNNPFAKSN